MAHYLTFDSSVTCTVNGVTVTSGYELHDGDVIVANANVSGAVFLVNHDADVTKYYYVGDIVDIYDDDVEVLARNGAAVSN